MTRTWILPGLCLSLLATAAHAQGVVRPGGRPGAPAPAAAAQTAGSQLLRLKAVKAESIETPRIDVQITGSSGSSAKANWLRVRAEYETAELWTDDVTFTYYALLKAKRREDVGANGKQMNLFKGSVTYVNVPRGKQYSDVFLHPDAFLRYAGGDRAAVERVAVVVSVNGQVVQELSDPAEKTRWWETLSPMPLSLMNHDQTPFGLGNLDDHRQIKAENR